MRLDGSGWVPGDPSSGPDPADGASIIDDPDDPGSTYFLKNQIAIYRSAIAEIEKYLNRATKAKPNPQGTTSGPQKITSVFKVDPAEHLKFLKEWRAQADAELQLQKDIAAERAAMWASQKETAELKKGKAIPEAAPEVASKRYKSPFSPVKP